MVYVVVLEYQGSISNEWYMWMCFTLEFLLLNISMLLATAIEMIHMGGNV